MQRHLSLSLLVLALAGSVAAGQRGGGGRGANAPQNQPKFQLLGPASGGRFAAIAGVIGDPKVWYLGAASGGVWKTSDSGSTWLPVFDEQPVQAIGSLATSQTDANIVWAGTGEAWAIRDADVV